MTTVQSKRLAALEKVALGTMEPWTIIHQIIRPDGSTQGYFLVGHGELAADDPRIKDYPPATPEVNGGYRLTDWIEMGRKKPPNGSRITPPATINGPHG
ncbi:MAG: hypothetical protein ACYCVY_09340 [Acidiferrobacteraceae bacterium]